MAWTERQQAVFDLIQCFANLYPDSRYGPAHIAIDDQNLSDGNIDFCMRGIREAYAEVLAVSPPTAKRLELEATQCLLFMLRTLPEADRDLFEDRP